MKCNAIIALDRGIVDMIEVPVLPPSPTQVQIRMVTSLVSPGTERAWVHGVPNALPSYPYVPGYCCAGIVEQVGSNVTRFQPGQAVAAYAVDVGHREFGNVEEHHVVHIPQGVSFADAAFASLGQTSLQGVRKCRIELGETVVTIGMGLVGLLAMQLCKLSGTHRNIAIDMSDSRLSTASNCGADITINSNQSDWKATLANATCEGGPNVVIDSTGVPTVMSTSCQIAAPFGRVCILGCPRGNTDINFWRDVQKKSITIIGAHAVDSVPISESSPALWTFVDDATCFLHFVRDEKITLSPMVDMITDRHDALQAYRHLIQSSEDVLGMIINWQEDKR